MAGPVNRDERGSEPTTVPWDGRLAGKALILLCIVGIMVAIFLWPRFWSEPVMAHLVVPDSLYGMILLKFVDLIMPCVIGWILGFGTFCVGALLYLLGWWVASLLRRETDGQ